MIDTINKEKVIAYKQGELHLNGEFAVYLQTVVGNYYFCNAEYHEGGVRIITQTPMTRARYEAVVFRQVSL